MLILGAINFDTKYYTHPSNATKNTKYICPDCNEQLIFKKGKIKIPHFSHKVKSQCSYYEHPNESQIHKDAKLKLALLLKNKTPIFIDWNCVSSFCKIINHFEENNYMCKKIKYDDNDKVIVEYKSDCGKYIADIAIINNDNVKYIFEIKHTHETKTNVRPQPWFEIQSLEIINYEKNNTDLSKYYFDCCRMTGKRLCKQCKTFYKNKGYTNKEIKNLGYDEDFRHLCLFCRNEFANTENYNSEYDRCMMCDVKLFSIDRTNYENTKKMLKHKDVINCHDFGTELNCSFKDKDIVKKYGAKWSKENKKWFVPINVKLDKFTKWL